MNINIVHSRYLEAADETVLNRAEAIALYRKSFEDNNRDLMNHYFTYFVRHKKEAADDKIYQYYLQLKSDLELYKYLSAYKPNEQTIKRFLKNFQLPEDIFENVEINLFIGIGTCHGFVGQDEHKVFINIAIEKFKDSRAPYTAIDCTVMHELTHIVRAKSGKLKWTSLGSMLVEEGLACFVSKEILNLTDEDDDFVFPGNPKIQDKEVYNQLINLYLDNLCCEDNNTITKFMNFGDPDRGIPPGLGYMIGERLLRHYGTAKSADSYEIIGRDSTEIIKEWIKLRRSL